MFSGICLDLCPLCPSCNAQWLSYNSSGNFLSAGATPSDAFQDSKVWNQLSSECLNTHGMESYQNNCRQHRPEHHRQGIHELALRSRSRDAAGRREPQYTSIKEVLAILQMMSHQVHQDSGGGEN